MRRLITTLTLPLFLGHTTCNEDVSTDGYEGSPCETDRECKGDRICEEGRCISPSPSNSNCVPSCNGKECGDDGCQGSCGTCLSDYVCNSGGCVPIQSCIDTCASKGCDCGTVCGDSCGTCISGSECTDGCHCTCQPDCFGKDCGGDNCGGSCGTCFNEFMDFPGADHHTHTRSEPRLGPVD